MVSLSSAFLLSRDRLCGGVVTVPSFFGETAVQGDSSDRLLYTISHFTTFEGRDNLSSLERQRWRARRTTTLLVNQMSRDCLDLRRSIWVWRKLADNGWEVS